jgi:hypothetical protein
MCRIKIIAVGNHNNSSQFQQWPRPTRSTVTAIAATAQKLPTQRPPRLQTCGRPTSTQPVPFCSSYALDLFCCRCVHCFSPLLSVQYIGSLTVMKYSTTGNLHITWYVCMLYVYIYIYIYRFIDMCVYVYIYMCIYIYVCIYVCVYIYRFIYRFIYVFIFLSLAIWLRFTYMGVRATVRYSILGVYWFARLYR